MSKKKVASSKAARTSRSQLRAIILFSAVVFLIKVTWLSTQQGRGLLGADGENYLSVLDGLLKEGLP